MKARTVLQAHSLLLHLMLPSAGSVQQQDLLDEALALLASAPEAVADASSPAVLLSLQQHVTDAEADLSAAHHHSVAAVAGSQMTLPDLTGESHAIPNQLVAQNWALESVVVLTVMPVMAIAAAAAAVVPADLMTVALEAADAAVTAAMTGNVKDAGAVDVTVLAAVRMMLTLLMVLAETVAKTEIVVLIVTVRMTVTVVKTGAAPVCATKTLAGHAWAYVGWAIQPTALQLEDLPEGALLLVRLAVRACATAQELLAVAVVLEQLPQLLLGRAG